MVRPTIVLAAVVCLGATLSSQSPPGKRSVLITGDGRTILQASRMGATGLVTHLATGDIDGDHRIEIVAGGYTQVVPVRVNATAAPPDYEAGDIERRIAGALSTARHENQRVLVMWGERGDKGSEALLEATRRNAQVSRTVLYEYVVVRADVSRDRAPAAKYRADFAKGGLPYLTLLDAEGKVLANQPASAFRTASPATTKTPTAAGPASAITYDGASLNTFLKKHQAAYLEAEPLFNEALSRAKKEQKTLFVWFSAPW